MKLENLKASIITAFVVTCYISFILVLVNFGFNNNFVQIWVKSWAIAFILAVPSMLIMIPLINKKLKIK